MCFHLLCACRDGIVIESPHDCDNSCTDSVAYLNETFATLRYACCGFGSSFQSRHIELVQILCFHFENNVSDCLLASLFGKLSKDSLALYLLCLLAFVSALIAVFVSVSSAASYFLICRVFFFCSKLFVCISNQQSSAIHSVKVVTEASSILEASFWRCCRVLRDKLIFSMKTCILFYGKLLSTPYIDFKINLCL